MMRAWRIIAARTIARAICTRQTDESSFGSGPVLERRAVVLLLLLYTMRARNESAIENHA